MLCILDILNTDYEEAWLHTHVLPNADLSISPPRTSNVIFTFKEQLANRINVPYSYYIISAPHFRDINHIIVNQTNSFLPSQQLLVMAMQSIHQSRGPTQKTRTIPVIKCCLLLFLITSHVC